MTNQTHKELFNGLIALVNESETPFTKTVLPLDGKTYNVFTYELPSYSDFKKPYALEARGIMFEVDDGGDFIRLASLTPSKFFNYKENPFTMNLDLNRIDLVMNKLDGSMMSTYLHDGRVKLKSKANLTSEHANIANELLENDSFDHLHEFLQNMVENDFTVTLEYTSPKNQIVLFYPDDKLTVLSVRDHETMKTVPYEKVKEWMKLYQCEDCLVPNLAEKYQNDYTQFIESVKDISDRIEGFVVVLEDGTTFKIKTDAYNSLHKNKDSLIVTPKNLFEAVVLETSDDIKAMYHDQPEVIQLIEDMEDRVRKIFHEIKNVQHFYTQNKGLDKRDYAIKAKNELASSYFPIAMGAYLNPEKPIEFKSYLIKNFKSFGIKDDSPKDEQGNKIVSKIKKKKSFSP
jgi:T4 RnlA family RNA ligase